MPQVTLKRYLDRKQECKRGFTLIELLVASVAASILSLAALQVYANYHKLYLHLYGDYQKETAAILDELRRINPYCSGAIKRRPFLP